MSWLTQRLTLTTINHVDESKPKRAPRPQIAFTLDAPGDEELLMAWKQVVKFRMKKDYKERFRELMRRDVTEFKK